MGHNEIDLEALHRGLFGVPRDEHTTPPAQTGSLHDVALQWVDSERFRHILRDRLGLWPQDKWVCTDYSGRNGVYRMWVNLHDGYVSHGVLNSNWECGEVDFMLSCLQPGDAMLDIGANVGVFSVQAAAAVGSEGTVHSFEPSPVINRMLQRTIYENGLMDRCVLHPYGLGDRDTEGRYHRAAHSTNPGASFISQDGPEAGAAGEAIQVRRLDSLNFSKRVAFIKMDVEGFEHHIVRGAINLLRDHRPTVMSEFFPRSLRVIGQSSGAEYIAEWERLGYRVQLLEPDGSVTHDLASNGVSQFDGFDVPLNIVCTHRG